MADRADWDAGTRTQRHLAVAADAELRRRHPGQQYPPLRSAEPAPATDSQRAELASARSVMMPNALRSVMSRLAAMSRRRAPGSWAMSRRTRAWMVRKVQPTTSTGYQIPEKTC
jgi:hypothetical protein